MPVIKLNKRFYPTEKWEEMTPEEKNKISMRKIALKKFVIL